jgi:pimeloyl-ACP methyl ester carboxylesterase
MGTTEYVVERDGVQLHVTDQDGSESPVVVLHGLAGSGREMAATASALAPHRVLMIDSRGHGRSTRRPHDVSREAHVADVVYVIETVLGSAVTLIGQSMGGHTALLAAATRPDLVARLVLLEAGVGGDGSEQSRDALREYFDSWPRPFLSHREAHAFLGESPLGRAWLADLDPRGGGLWPRFEADVIVNTIAHVDAQARWREWSQITAPTLAVFARDSMFNDAAQRIFVQRGRRVTHVQLESGTHDAHLDAFQPWRAALVSFINNSEAMQ